MTIAVEIVHRFGDFALDVEFSIGQAGITALFGPSGAGKTTTIDAIAGLLHPQRGRISINGRIVLDTTAGVDLPPRRRRIGYVFQDARLFPHLRVRDNLLFGWRRTDRRLAQSAIDELVETLGVGSLLERRPAALSGGERQRVALGRALLMQPDALLMDEPLAGLDQARKAEILPYLERLRDEANIPMILVSHNIDEVARLADQIVVLRDGAVIASGSVFDINSRLDLTTLGPEFEAGAVLNATVHRHDAVDALTELYVGGQILVVPLTERPVGTRLRLRIAARDVMLSLHEPADVSANNVIRGTIAEVRTTSGPYADVLIAVGDWRLPARITGRSLRRLALAPGREVYALIKAVTVDRGAAPAGTTRAF